MPTIHHLKAYQGVLSLRALRLQINMKDRLFIEDHEWQLQLLSECDIFTHSAVPPIARETLVLNGESRECLSTLATVQHGPFRMLRRDIKSASRARLSHISVEAFQNPYKYGLFRRHALTVPRERHGRILPASAALVCNPPRAKKHGIFCRSGSPTSSAAPYARSRVGVARERV